MSPELAQTTMAVKGAVAAPAGAGDATATRAPSEASSGTSRAFMTPLRNRPPLPSSRVRTTEVVRVDTGSGQALLQVVDRIALREDFEGGATRTGSGAGWLDRPGADGHVGLGVLRPLRAGAGRGRARPARVVDASWWRRVGRSRRGVVVDRVVSGPSGAGAVLPQRCTWSHPGRVGGDGAAGAEQAAPRHRQHRRHHAGTVAQSSHQGAAEQGRG